MNNLVEIRAVTPKDEAFIYSSWLRSYRNAPAPSLMSNDVYYSNHKLIIENLLSKTTTKILCTKEDPDHILGFICYEKDTLHYLYVKYSYRKMGLAKLLFGDAFGAIGENTVVKLTHPMKKNDKRFDINTYLLERVR